MLSTPQAIRVLVADADHRVRAAVRLTLKRHADIEIVGEAQDGTQAVALVLGKPLVVKRAAIEPDTSKPTFGPVKSKLFL